MGKRQSMLEAEEEEKARKKGKDVKQKKRKKTVRLNHVEKCEVKKTVDKASKLSQATPAGENTEEEPPVDIGRLDLRVGKIVWVQPHPLKADTHYMQHIHLRGSHLVLFVSELVQHYKECELGTGELGEKPRPTVVLCNLKPPKIYGLISQGMVVCAVKDGKAELLNAPKGVKANDKIYVKGYPRRPDVPYMKPYKNIYETVIEDLRVNDQKQVVYKGIPLEVEGRDGFITTDTLTDCPVKCV